MANILKTLSLLADIETEPANPYEYAHSRPVKDEEIWRTTKTQNGEGGKHYKLDTETGNIVAGNIGIKNIKSGRTSQETPKQNNPTKTKVSVGGDIGAKLYDDIMNDIEGRITIEKLAEHPLIQKAEKMVGAQGNPTSEINTPEREEMRNNCAKHLLAIGSFTGKDEEGNEKFGGKIKKGFRAEIVLGPPAAGKSSVIVNKSSKEYGAHILDSDEIKKMLPEFEDGNGASRVHKESSDILKQKVLAQFEKGGERNGENVVIPLVGKTITTPLYYIQALKDAGYDVHVSFNDVTAQNSAKRAIARYLKTKRYLPISYIKEVGNQPAQTYELLKDKYKSIISSFRRLDNNVPLGHPPIEKEFIETNKA